VAGGLNDLFSRLGGRRGETPGETGASAAAAEPDLVYPTKALPRFLANMSAKPAPALLDLGPVVGGNVSFFGEELGCRIRVEDVFGDIERHAVNGTLDALPEYFRTRFKSEPGTVDGILCWDVFDYLERAAAASLAAALARLLVAEGSLLGFFSTASDAGRAQYTKYLVVDQGNLRYRTYPGTRVRQRSLQNRDIIKLFESLRVSDSFLMKTNMREIVFRKPAYLAGL
jgi:hypothetical protein